MNASLKSFMRRWHSLILPFPFANVHRLPAFLAARRKYQAMPGGDGLRWSDSYLCLSDATTTTAIDAHYFHQSAWLARRLAEQRPASHIDVGSSVSMLGVISGFVPTTFVDIRPVEITLKNFECLTGSIVALPFTDHSVESLSCLHVIEHIGLGRYGDPLDPAGSQKAAKELIRVLAPQGRLFLSTPVGRERVCFNAHRIFAPQTIVAMFGPLSLASFAWVDDRGVLRTDASLAEAAGANYGCGLFEFGRQA
jgi:SAM-dependent methyltransferase